MQSVSSRIWTRVVVSISYDDNHYTTGILFKIVPLGSHTPTKMLYPLLETVPEVFNCHCFQLLCHDLSLFLNCSQMPTTEQGFHFCEQEITISTKRRYFDAIRIFFPASLVYRRGLQHSDCSLCREVRIPPMSVVGMISIIAIIAITPRSTLARNILPIRILSLSQINLKTICIR